MKTQRFIMHTNDPNRMHVLRNAHAFLDRLPPDKSWALEIRQYSKPRSVQQNRAMFGLAYDILADFCGYDSAQEKEMLHAHMCAEFFGFREMPIIGRVAIRTTTTNEAGERDVISRQVMADFYAFIQRQAAQIGCYIPDPDPLHGSEA